MGYSSILFCYNDITSQKRELTEKLKKIRNIGIIIDKYSHEQVAKMVGSTRNKIINEEKKILRKLRNPKSCSRECLLNAKKMILEK